MPFVGMALILLTSVLCFMSAYAETRFDQLLYFSMFTSSVIATTTFYVFLLL